MLEKTLESPLDCKEIQPVYSEDQPWDFFERTDAKVETPVLWPPHAKSSLIGKDSDAGKVWGQECKFSAAMAAGILIFPCSCDAAGDRTGILNLSTPVSNVFHCICAALLFASFAYMIGWRFTKTDMPMRMTGQKEIRNTVYRACAGVIILFMLCQVVTSLCNIGWMTIVNEAMMLWAFSFAWAVKAGVFIQFKD